MGYTLTKGAVYTDDGSEFKSVFKSFLKDAGIDQVVAVAGDKRKNPNIERWNGTLRGLIEKFALVYGRPDSKAVKKLADAYNHSVHSSLDGLSPLDALTDMKKSRGLFDYYLALKVGNSDKDEPEVLPKGTWVRWYIRSESSFKKIGKNWSKTMYQVESYDPKTKSYKLEGLKKRLRREYLQVIDKENFDRYNHKPSRHVEHQHEDEGRKVRRVRLNKDELEVMNRPVIEGKRQRKKTERLDL